MIFGSRNVDLAGVLALGLFGLTTMDAVAADPCGGALIGDGVVKVQAPLTVEAELSAPTKACLAHLAAELSGRAGLRSVTVTVRVGDDKRADGTGQGVLDAYKSDLVAGGLPQARVSGVVAGGDDEGVHITFSQRQPANQVAQVLSQSGEVTASAGGAANPLSSGDRLAVGTVIETGSAGRAMLELADKSHVRIGPSSSVTLGKLHLNDAMQRIVELQVDRGSIDTVVTPGGEGSSFNVRTPYGTAGVRGTSFRVSADVNEQTRLETLTGLVEFEGSSSSVMVGALHGSILGTSGTPTEPESLLAAPAIRSPLGGTITDKGLRWKRVKQATNYVVEAARDAEFVLEGARHEAAATSMVPDLSDGTWYWRVASVDTNGFVGPWSEVYQFDVGSKE
ncbi:MAG: hypothetical protein ACI9MC_000461 [Kiritimatiellia bacterium]|jgi:hypothetical protein